MFARLFACSLVLALLMRLFTDLEAVSASVPARKSAEPPHVFRNLVGPFAFASRIDTRLSCWPSICPLLGGSLVKQPEPCGWVTQRYVAFGRHKQDQRRAPKTESPKE